MSKCISSHGEYSKHEPGDPCPWCGEWDTERIIAERDQARAQVDRVRELLTKWVDEYSDPVYRGNGWTEGVRDAAREALKELDGER